MLTSDKPVKQGTDNAAMNHEAPPEYNHVVVSGPSETYNKIEEAAMERKSRSSTSFSSEPEREIITSTF